MGFKRQEQQQVENRVQGGQDIYNIGYKIKPFPTHKPELNQTWEAAGYLPMASVTELAAVLMILEETTGHF